MRPPVRAVALITALAVLSLTSCGQDHPLGGSAPTSPPAAPGSSPPTASTTTGANTVAPPATAAQPSPATSLSAPAIVVARGNSDRRVVALTFDAGSDAGNTATILDILSSQHIPATFGITGLWAQANPALVRRIAAAGHQIVNHSWDHQSFTGYSTKSEPLTKEQIIQELARTDALIRQLSGSGIRGWFRPPYGDRNASVDAVAGAAGYRFDLTWTVDTLGWKGVSVDTVVQRCVTAASPGEIILMHVGSASTDASALPTVIAALRDRGYGFATVSGII